MSKRAFWTIIILMSIALLGLISLQANWIMQSIRINQQKIDAGIFTALHNVVDRLQMMENQKALDMINGFEKQYIEAEVQKLLQAPAEGITQVPGGTNVAPIPADKLSALLLSENDCTCSKCQREREVKYWRILKTQAHQSMHGLEERIALKTLDKVLHQELENSGISVNFNYGVYSQKKKNFIITDNHYVIAEEGPFSSQDGFYDELMNSRYKAYLFPQDNQTNGLLMVYFPGLRSEIWKDVIWPLIGSALFTFIVLGCFIYSLRVIFVQKKVSEIKTDFINNMTHEFKTPIATISLATDSIMTPAIMGNQEKIKKFAEIIRQENRRMNSQVEKVLQMAMIERHEIKLKLSRVDLHQVISDAATFAGLKVEKRNGIITTQLDASSPWIEGDLTHVTNMINNLLDNAIKYTLDLPEILISTTDQEQGTLVTVRDNGIGISKEDRKNIFDKFYRVHTGNVHDVKGFGLGLAYVKALMEAHGGWVDVKSEPGKGSSFQLFFPKRLNN